MGVLVASAVAACHHESARPPVAQETIAATPPTANALPDPKRAEAELARRVAVLAAIAPCFAIDSHGDEANLPCVESEGIGDGGAASKAFAAARLVAEAGNRAQLLALLAHPSPLVRAYIARWVGENSPDDVSRLVPLLADTTRVMVINGCIGREATIALVVVDALGSADGSDEAHALLRTITSDAGMPSEVRARALDALTSPCPIDVRAIALAWLSSKDPRLAAGAVRALAEAGAPADLPAIAALATHPDENVRFELARTLGMSRAPLAREVLARMRNDKKASVRSAATHWLSGNEL